MSNIRMWTLVAILVGALFTGACADDVLGPTGAVLDDSSVVRDGPASTTPDTPAGPRRKAYEEEF